MSKVFVVVKNTIPKFSLCLIPAQLCLVMVVFHNNSHKEKHTIFLSSYQLLEPPYNWLFLPLIYPHWQR